VSAARNDGRFARAAACASWLSDHLDLFTISTDDTPESDVIALMKPISELALVAAVLHQVARRSRLPRALRDFARAAGTHSWEQLGRGELMSSYLARFPELVILATTYRSFRVLGFRHAGFERLLENTLGLRGTRALEFPPWRALDLATAVASLNLTPPWAIASIYRRTWLAALPEPWALTPSSAYSVTHTVFYMTDFGDAPNRLPAGHRAYLRRWTPAWQLFYANVQDMDLLAEMTMVMRCLREPQDSVDVPATFAAHTVGGGGIRGPMELEPEVGASRTSARALTFTRDYHTTLVGLLALAM
jgi:hypothetical protein